jgi:hypothetical protein
MPHIESNNPREDLAMQVPGFSPHLISGRSSSQGRGPLLLFVIDFSDFMCMSCLDSFITFCQSFPPHYLEDKAWGILVLASKDEMPYTKNTAQIAERKLRGFITANSIEFPIIIDHNQVFQSFAVEGTALVVLDAERGRILRYSFPIKRADSQKIREIFLKN